jgi:hypothetical protein
MTNDPVFSKAFADFDRQLKAMEKMTMDNQGKLLWKYSSQFAAALVRGTQPRGAAAKAQKLGQNAVHTDVQKAYGNANAIYMQIKRESEGLAKVMWAAWQNGDNNTLVEVLRNTKKGGGNVAVIPWDGGKHHKKNRDARGRYRGGNVTTMIEYKDRANVRTYIHKVQKRVGYAKSGWVSGFNPPSGIRGVPKWVLANRGGHGRVVDKTKNGETRLIEFVNNVSYVKKKFNWKAVEGALRVVTRRMRKDMEKIVVEAAKKVK